MKKLNGKSDREKSLLSNAMLQAAPGIACRCPLPGKYLPVRARQPLAGRIAASSRQSRSLSVALQMSARASTAAACRAYRCQLTAEPFAVRCPANVCSCKHGSRLPGVSLPAHGRAVRCPLPCKCLLVQARQPLAGRIAQKIPQKAGLPLCFLQDLNFLFRFSGLH